MINMKEKANIFMEMVYFILDNGKIIKKMEKGNYLIKKIIL